MLYDVLLSFKTIRRAQTVVEVVLVPALGRSLLAVIVVPPDWSERVVPDKQTRSDRLAGGQTLMVYEPDAID